MRALIATELLELRTRRGPGVMAAGTMCLGAALAVLGLAGAGRHGAPSIGTTGALLDLLGPVRVLGVAAVVPGALLVTDRHRHGTLTQALLRTPSRGRLVLALAATAALVFSALGFAATLMVAAVAAGGGALTVETLTVPVAARALGLLAAFPVFGLVGLAIGLLVPRHQATAAILPVAWTLILEELAFGSFGQHMPPWTVGRLAASASGALDVAPVLPFVAAATALLGALVILLVAGGLRFRRLDLP
jgi:hypothetical protein